MAPTVTVTPLAYEALPGRVVFGAGAVSELGPEVARLGAERALLVDGLFDLGLRERIETDLGGRHAGTLSEVAQHVPAELAAAAQTRAEALGADCLVAVGGGSATGVAKAVAKETGLPIVALPTTYAGSEMTPIWGVTEAARKLTGRDLRVLPRTVVYDPELTVSLPPLASAASGMNAIAHCVEALWSANANPVTDAVAGEGIALLAAGLRGAVRDPRDLGARTVALRGAWLGGTALAVGGTGLHHKICHVLGGTFRLPHAEVHAVVLPEVVDLYREAAPAAQARVAVALGAGEAGAGLRELAADLGLGISLGDLGFRSEDVPLAAELAAAVAPEVPAPVTRAEIEALLERVTTGREL